MVADTESWVLMAIVVILAIVLIAGCACTVYPKTDPVLTFRRPQGRRDGDGVYVMPGSMARSGSKLAKSGAQSGPQLAKSGAKSKSGAQLAKSGAQVRSRTGPPPHLRQIQPLHERLID
jgi:hypothetical protein